MVINEYLVLVEKLGTDNTDEVFRRKLVFLNSLLESAYRAIEIGNDDQSLKLCDRASFI